MVTQSSGNTLNADFDHLLTETLRDRGDVFGIWQRREGMGILR